MSLIQTNRNSDGKLRFQGDKASFLFSLFASVSLGRIYICSFKDYGHLQKDVQINGVQKVCRFFSVLEGCLSVVQRKILIYK